MLVFFLQQNNGWTPLNYSSRSDFWEFESGTYLYAGVYRLEPHLQDDEWEFMTSVYFNPAFQGGLASSGCSMRIIIYNENYERMFSTRIEDGAASASDHRLCGRVYYFDSSNTGYNVLTTSDETSDYDINNDFFGMKLNSSNNFYVYFPDKVPDSNGWRLATTESIARTRGTMTYLTIQWHKWWEAPVDAHFTAMNFSASEIGPQINQPPDLAYFENTKDHHITWTAIDNNPTTYEIVRYDIHPDGSSSLFGTLISSYWSSGVPIVLSIDNLPSGKYNFTIQVNDADGGYARDSVFVTVIAEPTQPTDTTTTSSSSSTSFGSIMFAMIILGLIFLHRK